MGSCYGKNIRLSVFGQSHSAAIGVCIDGLPHGFKLDEERLQKFMERRAPGRNAHSTARREADAVEILSGLADGYTCGAPLAMVIRNTNTRSGDYSQLRDIPRPAHADFAANVKFGGYQDVAGGGHFSGRLTAPICAAGGICLQMLSSVGIEIGAHIESIGAVCDRRFDQIAPSGFEELRSAEFAVLDAKAGEKMRAVIAEAKAGGDSVGGVVECAVTGLPAGVGDPMFDGMENRIASIVFGIPAVKGLEFGNGFECARLRGTENNDSYYMDGNMVKTRTNNHGGILGGISSGMPIVFRAAFKPTPSVAAKQDSVSLSRGEDAELVIHGRHDPCIVPRAVPVVEAASAIAVLDAWLDYKKYL